MLACDASTTNHGLVAYALARAAVDGHHPEWTAEDQSGPVPLLRADGRSRALPTPGGDRRFTLRYRPRWRAPALALCAIGALCVLVLALRR